MMRGDVDVLRIELTQLVDDIIHFLDAVSLQRRQDLEREGRALTIIDQVDYSHIVTNFEANVTKIEYICPYTQIISHDKSIKTA